MIGTLTIRTLDNLSCQGHGEEMHDVEVIESAAAAVAALDPVRARLLGELAVPASAAGLAARLGMARQLVNYHLRALEAHGLVELSEERRHGGLTERVLQASAASFYQAGLPGAGIGVDTDDPIAEMARYRGLGYDAVDALVGYARVLQ